LICAEASGQVGCYDCIQKVYDNTNMVQGHLVGIAAGQAEAAMAHIFDGHSNHKGGLAMFLLT